MKSGSDLLSFFCFLRLRLRCLPRRCEADELLRGGSDNGTKGFATDDLTGGRWSDCQLLLGCDERSLDEQEADRTDNMLLLLLTTDFCDLVFLTWGSAEELRERGDSDMMR
jgi:hypothetical protein